MSKDLLVLADEYAAAQGQVPQAWTNVLAYALQDDLHNRLTPRVIDIAYNAFMQAKQPNKEDGGASDWFNDTKPMVNELIAKLRKDLVEEFGDATIPQQPAEAPDLDSRDFYEVMQAYRHCPVDAEKPFEAVKAWLRNPTYPYTAVPQPKEPK